MTDTNMTRKDNNHGMPTHYGYRNKDFNDMVNSFFNNWLDFPYENTAMKAAEPKLEVSEDENEVKVAAELPGMSEKDVDLEISADGYLTISGEKKQERKAQGKKVTAGDERYFKLAEEHLYGELAIALGIEKDKVGSYIEKRIA